MSAVTSSVKLNGASLTILGDVFLRNVVAVFDIGKNEMRFAERKGPSSPNSTASSTGPSTGSATDNQAKLLLLTLLAMSTILIVV